VRRQGLAAPEETQAVLADPGRSRNTITSAKREGALMRRSIRIVDRSLRGSGELFGGDDRQDASEAVESEGVVGG
jgi:hypothetical protein